MIKSELHISEHKVLNSIQHSNSSDSSISEEGPVVSRSVQRATSQLHSTLMRSLTFVNMQGSALEQSLNTIHQFDKSQIGRWVFAWGLGWVFYILCSL